MRQRIQQIRINRMHRQAARRTATVILLKTLTLLTAVGQLTETVRQLNAFVIDLKAFGHTVIFGTDLRQGCLAGRKMINEAGFILTNLRFHTQHKQQHQ